MSKAAKPTPKKPIPTPESFNLPPTGVESHAHLNGKYFAEDREAALERAKNAGIARIGQVFMGAEKWAQGKVFFDHHPEVFFLLGVHPTEAQNLSRDELDAIKAAVQSDSRIRAIGEIGLDYYWKDCPPEVQQRAFHQQLELAKELDMPVAIHCRDADNSTAAVEDTFRILQEENFKGRPLLWHCFGGNADFARRILDNGWHISIPGTVTFPANHELRAALPHIPLERLMMETDCPFLTPVPFRGKRNEPAYLAYTIQVMAEAKGMNAAELWTSCGKTALEFFNLPPL